MKRLLIFAMAALLCVAASAQVEDLGRRMEVSDLQAWNDFASKMQDIHKRRPVVALVLGGGGAKGAAHIGVLKYLEKIDMPVDMVVGTSMGGLIGSMFALGYTPWQIDSLVTNLDWPTLMSDKLPDEVLSFEKRRYKEKFVLDIPFDVHDHRFSRSIPSAYINGQNVGNLISSLTVGYQDDISFSDLPVPFACVSTDLISGKGVVNVSGSLNDALRTTMSIPLVFSPLRKDGRFLVDGGMIDNFPSDVARALGADIIIGVSVDTPSIPYDEAYNFMDVVSLFIDLSGKTRLEHTLQIPDLVVRPDLEGLGSLSFTPENINKLISNGYKAALDSAEVFSTLREEVAGEGFALNAQPARSLVWDKIKIGNLQFNGLTQNEIDVLGASLDIHPGQYMDKTILDANVSRLYATQAFRRVNYRLLGTGPEYDLLLDCEKGPLHRFGLGVRFDTEEMVSALLNIGFFAHSIYGSRLDLTFKLSANPYGRIQYSFNLPNFPRLCLSVDARYANTSLMDYSISPFKTSYFISNQEFALADYKWVNFNLRGGLRNTVARVGSCSLDLPYIGRGLVHSGAFIHGNVDKMTGGEYYPVSGFKTSLGYSWQFKSNLREGELFHDNNYHVAYFGIDAAVTPVDYFTWLVGFKTRMLFAPNHENIPLYARNMIGGDMNGRYFEQQWAFEGINNVYALDDAMMLLRTDFRFKFAKRQYLAAKLHAALHNVRIFDDYSVDSAKAFVDNHLAYGACLSYSYSTFLGPLKFNLHWSNVNSDNKFKGFGIYLSAGFNF